MTRTEANQSNLAGSSAPLVAVVDDDVSFLRSAGRLLRSAGLSVRTFSSAAEFLASLPAFRPQCLLLDVHMPEMTGLELQDWLAAQGSCVPIIFVTAFDTPHTREHACRAGGFGVLLKPFDQDDLLRAIREAIAQHSSGSGRGENHGQAEPGPSPPTSRGM